MVCDGVYIYEFINSAALYYYCYEKCDLETNNGIIILYYYIVFFGGQLL